MLYLHHQLPPSPSSHHYTYLMVHHLLQAMLYLHHQKIKQAMSTVTSYGANTRIEMERWRQSVETGSSTGETMVTWRCAACNTTSSTHCHLHQLESGITALLRVWRLMGGALWSSVTAFYTSTHLQVTNVMLQYELCQYMCYVIDVSIVSNIVFNIKYLQYLVLFQWEHNVIKLLFGI